MKTLQINLPDDVNENDAKMLMAGILFERGELSSGQAAKLIGVTRRFFLENIGRYGFSVFQETIEDLNKKIFEE